MGLSKISGFKYISRLEKGQIKKSYLDTILNYLDAVGVKWETFFRELSIIQSKQDHEKIMSRATRSVVLSHSSEMTKDLNKKLDRDTMLYETKIKPPLNYYTKPDMNLIRKKVELKVRQYCQQLQIREDLIPHYLKFAQTILTARKYQPVIDKFTKSGISQMYLLRIMNIANKIYHNEEKKTAKQKPIRYEKARVMAEKYLQSRIKLALIESEVSKILDQYLARDNVYYNLYMNFARQCYKAYKTYYQKDAPLLEQKLKNITGDWLANKLKAEILEIIKETIVCVFLPIK
jgi:transcriptional regulator with XRE-family HTH domain